MVRCCLQSDHLHPWPQQSPPVSKSAGAQMLTFSARLHVPQQVESGLRCTCPRWTRLMLLADQSLTSTWSCRQRSRCDARWQLGKMAVLDLALSLSLIGTLQRLFTDWGLSPLAKRIAELGFCPKQVFAPCFICSRMSPSGQRSSLKTRCVDDNQHSESLCVLLGVMFSIVYCLMSKIDDINMHGSAWLHCCLYVPCMMNSSCNM